LGREVGRARFQAFGEPPQAFWGFIRPHQFLPPPIPHLFLGLKVSLPGVVGVAVKVIIVHGKSSIAIPNDDTLQKYKASVV
jgi:hypothetical protein